MPTADRLFALAALALLACAGVAPKTGSPATERPRRGDDAGPSVLAFALVSADEEKLVGWLRTALALEPAERRPLGESWDLFAPEPSPPSSRQWLALGREVVEVRRWLSPQPHPYPPSSRADDIWFQHLAVVVSDIDAAYARIVRGGIVPISSSPQTIPKENQRAGGIRAYYFRDPEGHPFELLWYPPGRGDPRWQARRPGLFLGIDHSAIVVRDTRTSLAFYQDLLGLHVAGGSTNEGIEQEHLSGVAGARVRITSLHGISGAGIELLEYEAPRRERPPSLHALATDVASTEIRLRVPSIAALEERLLARQARPAPRDGDALLLADPDGHRLRIVGNPSPGDLP
jgi:catechol 2,3-dioxygenase-like lactoylglutathione lyase family enzyme